MGCLTSHSPATWLDCLDLGGSRPLARKVLIWQKAAGDSVVFCDDGEVVAGAFLVVNGEGETEFALSIRVGARVHMRALCRIAHLTLGRLAETGAVIVCHVMPGNRSGERMARLVGFSPAGGKKWQWSGRDGSSFGTIRGRQQGGEGGGREEPAIAAGGE